MSNQINVPNHFLPLTNKLGVAIANICENHGDKKDLVLATKFHLLAKAVDTSNAVVGFKSDLTNIHATLSTLNSTEDGMVNVTPLCVKNLWLLYDVVQHQLASITQDEFDKAKTVAKVNI